MLFPEHAQRQQQQRVSLLYHTSSATLASVRSAAAAATAAMIPSPIDHTDSEQEEEEVPITTYTPTTTTATETEMMAARIHSFDVEQKQQQIPYRPRLDALRSRLQQESLSKNNNSHQQMVQSIVQEDEEEIRITNTITTADGKKKKSLPSSPTHVHVQHDNIQQTQQHPQRSSSMEEEEEEEEEEEPSSSLRQTLANLPEPPPPIPTTSSILTDSYGRFHNYLRISLTERCNLRCTYCMPEAGVPLQPASHLLSTHELLRLASHFRNRGVTKFRLTGGEPTLRSDILAIVQGLQTLHPERIGMTTNGVVLGSKSNSKSNHYHPDTTTLLSQLVQAGLNSLNISLDTMDPDKFAKLTRRPAPYLDRVWTCLDRAMELVHTLSSHLVVKLNCVVMRGTNEDEIDNFIQLTDTYPGLQVRFIEYMPFSENGWNWEKCIPYREILEKHSNNRLISIPSDDPHDTTKWFTTTTAETTSPTHNSTPPERSPKIGFITSMSHHFCGTCNRLRLTADGKIKVCLFDTTEISLRDAIRTGFTDTELDKIIYAAVSRKKAALGGHKNPADIMKDADNNRPMTLIGG
jgi:cyclic pyranopterin phosphate synthase